MTSMELRVKGVFTGEETEAKLKDRPRSPSHSVAQRGHAPALWNSHSVLFPLGGGCSHDTNDHLKEEPIHPVFQNFLICLFYSFKIEKPRWLCRHNNKNRENELCSEAKFVHSQRIAFAWAVPCSPPTPPHK